MPEGRHDTTAACARLKIRRERERERVARVGAYRAALVDGPVPVLPLTRANFRFNPQTPVAYPGQGSY